MASWKSDSSKAGSAKLTEKVSMPGTYVFTSTDMTLESSPPLR
jgi:hypothetical protein